jgi:menaquinone-dependent protoporphyrinogen IX oxidase
VLAAVVLVVAVVVVLVVAVVPVVPVVIVVIVVIVPVAIVPVAVGRDNHDTREATPRCIDEFLEGTGWTPGLTVPIAGALQYREYDVFTRLLMRLMMRRGGHPTDASHDYDYTDWDAVERFGREFATLVAQTSR